MTDFFLVNHENRGQLKRSLGLFFVKLLVEMALALRSDCRLENASEYLPYNFAIWRCATSSL